MGVADRGYMQGRRQPLGFGLWSVSARFVILLVVVYVATKGARAWFGWHGEPRWWLTSSAVHEGRFGTLLTSAFLGSGGWALVFDCLGIWFFGKLAEDVLGARRYLAFLALGVVVPHAAFAGYALATSSADPVVGPGGIVFAALTFAAFRFPSLPVRLWLVPMLLWQMAAIYVAVDVFQILTDEGRGGLGHASVHLAGAALGFAVHRFGLLSPRSSGGDRPAAKPREPGPFAIRDEDAEVDRILDKINAGGIGSLTDDERAFLTSRSKRR